MQSLSRRFIHGFQIQNLQFIHGFQRLVLYSTAPSSDPLANYLTDSLGFSEEQALSISTKFSQTNRKVNHLTILHSNATSVVSFLKTHGFDDTLITNILSSNPRLLSYKVDKTIKPKFDTFKELGFSGSDIIKLVSGNPYILSMGLDTAIVPAIQIFRKILGCDSQVIAVIRGLRVRNFVSTVHNLFPNVALLTDYGIPFELTRKHFLRRPIIFLRNPDTFKAVVSRVEHKLGIRPDSPLFLYGVHILCSFSDDIIESKFRMLKSFGWTQSDIDTFIMKNASCFTISDVSIKKKMDFLMNELQLEPAYLTTHTCLFTCSLEKRVVPRHKVLMILKEKILLTKYPSLSSAVQMPEARFLKTFVLPFKEVHKVYADHTGCSLKMLR
ncbi:uncharacterized protein LOC141590143 [Silene latifolia]|uniref:uncharacterized protein LOC141590143 n=1 Tax=Silene latifolia TaxID=37657 RepID=UPI003D78A393